MTDKEITLSSLLATRRFLPLFIAQFTGTFNDNLFKNAIATLVTYRIAQANSAMAGQLVNLAYGLFILPLFLFSPLAGQMADKFSRHRMARIVKLLELALVFLAGLCLYLQSVPLLLLTLFGFGVDTTFFGPVKYALLPQHLRDFELMRGNAYIDASAYFAIILGAITGAKLALAPGGVHVIAGMLVVSSIFGYIASWRIPEAAPPAPDLRISFNWWRDSIALIREAYRQRVVFLCILGMSWFWFIGTLLLAQIPSFTKDVLHADQNVMSLLLVILASGIAAGSIVCSRLMHGTISATPVPLAALGLTIFAFRVSADGIPVTANTLLGISGFLERPEGWRIVTDLFLLAFSGGFYNTPLYTLLQKSAEKATGARLIACNNFINGLFTVAAALLAVGMLKMNFTVPDIFLAAAIMNLSAMALAGAAMPFSLLRVLLRLAFRVEVRGSENLANAGERLLIIANHTSLLDAPLIAAFIPRPIVFAVNIYFARKWWMKVILRFVDAYKVDPASPLATKAMIEVLKQNRTCMVFPEGRISETGALMKVFDGPGMIADKAGATILPVHIDGAQYTPWSHLLGKAHIRLFPKITLTIGSPFRLELPVDVKGRERRRIAREQIYDTMSGLMFASRTIDTTLMKALLKARLTHGSDHVIVEDQERLPTTYNQLFGTIAILARAINRNLSPAETRVGLMLPNSSSTAAAFFALQALGRVPTMINYTSGPHQIISACRTATLRTVITSARFVDLPRFRPLIEPMKSAGIQLIFLEDLRTSLHFTDRLAGLLSSIFPELLLRTARDIQPEDPAVLIFTSGSEGTPKGVVLSHRNIVANCQQISSRLDLWPQDTALSCVPMFHAFGLTVGTLLPIFSGIRTVFYPSPLHYRAVPEAAYDANSTILLGTDTFLSGYGRFVQHPYDFRSLRYVFSGAERLKKETSDLWCEKFGMRVLEGYGVTEASPAISANTAMQYRKGTAGRLLPGIAAKLEPMPGIENGQRLFVKGPNIMLGYMKEDTPGVLQAFTDEWYDTGDIASIDDDGYVTIVGRVKRFAKIAGEMISLEAVENAISSIWPETNNAVVNVPDPRKGEALVLFTDFQGAKLGPLNEALRKRGLPELSIPREIIKLDKLPTLGTGKPDYVRLKQMVEEE